jgi:hypothetical protein
MEKKRGTNSLSLIWWDVRQSTKKEGIMKKSTLMLGLVVFLAVVLAAGVLFAQKAPLKRGPVGRPPLPDLIVSDIELMQDCWIKVTLKNIGNGGVPASIYSGNYSAVQMYKGSQAHGGMVLREFDPSGLLKSSGASVSKVWFYGSPGLNLDPGVHSIRVDVDASGDVAESNENNNSRTERLTCEQQRLPDLIVSDIELMQDCKIKVTLKNVGTGGVPASVYSGNMSDDSAVQMYKGSQAHGGMVLRVFDPSGLLKSPGASVSKVWFPGAANLALGPGTHSIKVIVDNNNAVAESNENNNSRTERLTCEPPVRKCCIAGTYNGEHKDTLSATCADPKTEKFILTITQSAGCGSSITGEVKTIKSGVPTLTHRLAGTVTPAGDCCRLEGRLTEFPALATAAGKVIPITATLCEKGGKWYSTNGVYTDPTGCSGTFTLKQQ